MSFPAQQARIMLAMVLCGAVLGMIYDALCLLGRTMFHGRIAQGLMDLLYGVICAAGITMAALRLRIDAFRWYTLMAAAGGIGLYRLSVGVWLRALWAWIQRLRKKLTIISKKAKKDAGN